MPMSTDKPDPLIELLDALPLGISARAGGVPFYQNRAGGEHAAIAPQPGDTSVAGRTINVEEVAVSLLGANVDVRLSRDVTAQRELENELFKRAYFDDL